MKLTIVLLLICSLVNAVYAKKIATFPELNRPNNFVIDGDRLFISDCPSVYIYSFNDGDIQLMKKFGEVGNGPGEFKKVLSSFYIIIRPGYIFVNSRGKISYFTRTGEFIREKNVAGVGYSFSPLNDKILGRKVIHDNNKLYLTIKMFDSDLKELAELTRQLNAYQPEVKDIKAFSVAFSMTTGGNKIFAVTSVDFTIKIFDYQGKLLHTIDEKNRIKRIKIENKHKEDYHNYMTIVFPEYQRLKERVVFPEYFPAIRGLSYIGGKEKLYVITWKQKNSNSEFFIFDTKGTFIKKAFLPIKEQNVLRFYPYKLKDGNVYQLIENDDGDWELHINPID